MNMATHAGRRGKARQKIGLWGTLSPYYCNAITIDSRWTQTLTNQHD